MCLRCCLVKVMKVLYYIMYLVCLDSEAVLATIHTDSQYGHNLQCFE